MKNQRDKLRQYKRRITDITDRETDIARQCLAAGDKKKALLALRRKKYQESLLSQTDQQLEQLEQLTSSIEFALVQKDVLFGLQRGSEVLKLIHAEMGGVEGVEKIMADTEEAHRYQDEISQMLAGQLSNNDEDEVEDELEELERQVVGVVQLPEAPTHIVPALPDTPQTDLEREERRKARAKERRMQALASA